MYQVVLVTAKDRSQAEAIAAHLVEARLAACVNILGGMQSVFVWEGQVQREEEVLLIIKSKIDLWASLQEAICQRHSYSVPEVIALPITQGFPPYLQWMDDNTRASA